MKYVTVLVSRFKRLLGFHSEAPSLLRALSRIAGKSCTKQVLSSSSDRRYWVTLTAAWLGLSERELLSSVARDLELGFEARAIERLDLSLLGSAPRDMIAELRRVGAVFRDDTVFTVDPAELKSLSYIPENLAVKLAPWSLIDKALRDLESILDEREEVARSVEQEKQREIAKQILGFLITEVESYHGQSLTVLNSDEGLTYSFVTQDQRQASGRVFPRVAPHLLEMFEGTPESERIRVLLRATGTYRSVKVTKIAPGGNFSLDWQITDEQKLVSEHAPVTISVPVSTAPVVREELVKAEPVPVVADLKEPPTLMLAPQTNKTNTRPLVVVIDDNVMFVKVLEKFLDRGGMDSVHAPNGEEGLKLLRSMSQAAQPVVVCDLHMPVMNGREFISKLRQDPILGALKVVILTSDDDVEAEVNLISLGADAFVAKSKDPRVLTAQVRRFAGLPPVAQAA